MNDISGRSDGSLTVQVEGRIVSRHKVRQSHRRQQRRQRQVDQPQRPTIAPEPAVPPPLCNFRLCSRQLQRKRTPVPPLPRSLTLSTLSVSFAWNLLQTQMQLSLIRLPSTV